jgi:hypothetical protein
MARDYSFTAYLQPHNTSPALFVATCQWGGSVPKKKEEPYEAAKGELEGPGDVEALAAFNIQRDIDLEWHIYKPWYSFPTLPSALSLTERWKSVWKAGKAGDQPEELDPVR